MQCDAKCQCHNVIFVSQNTEYGKTKNNKIGGKGAMNICNVSTISDNQQESHTLFVCAQHHLCAPAALSCDSGSSNSLQLSNEKHEK